MGEFWFASAAVSVGASLHPAGQTENGLVSHVPPKAKDRRLYWSRVFVGGEGSSWTSCLCRKLLDGRPVKSGGLVTPSGPPRQFG